MLEFYLSDKKQRRAFIDTRQSLEMKLVIEEQAKEQVGTKKRNHFAQYYETPFRASTSNRARRKAAL